MYANFQCGTQKLEHILRILQKHFSLLSYYFEKYYFKS